jgi:isoleucyl-tRNA synthetase
MAVKDRLYCDEADSPRRRRTQTALWIVADGLTRLLAPIIPHTADEAWRELRGIDADEPTSVHESRFFSGVEVTVDAAWSEFMRRRDDALRAMEAVRAAGEIDNPLDFGVVLPDPDRNLERFDIEDLADLLGVSRCATDPALAEPRVDDLRDQPMCERSRKRHRTVKRRSNGGYLSDRDAAVVGVE